jgi:hypothetical protein
MVDTHALHVSHAVVLVSSKTCAITKIKQNNLSRRYPVTGWSFQTLLVIRERQEAYGKLRPIK